MRLPLRVFLFGSLAFSALAPLGYLGVTQTLRWREVQSEEVDKELILSAEHLARTIAKAIETNVRPITVLANSLAAGGTGDHELVSSLLRNHCSTYPACLGISVADANGDPYLSSDPQKQPKNLAGRKYYADMLATGQPSMSGVEIGRLTKLPTIHIAAPIWKQEDGRRVFAGSVVSAMGLPYLQDISSQAVQRFPDMHVEILDDTRRVVTDSNPLATPALTDRSRSPLHAPDPDGKTTLRRGQDDHGEAIRLALTDVPLEHCHWSLVVIRSMKAINAQTSRSLQHTVLVTLGALVFGLLLAVLLSRRLARPIVRLTQFATRVAKDGPQPKPAVASLDPREVTELTETVFSMVAKLQEQTQALREREQEQIMLAKVRQELDIAARIQAGILPKRFEFPGFEFAARVQPAENIGGDYYEILATDSGFWVAAGDVSGHGLTAGLVMLMLQSALAALATYAPHERPSEILRATNALLVENIRRRLGGDDHVTLVLMHVDREGRFVFAGGHEPLLILRHGGDHCELVETPGPWMGILPKLGKDLRESQGHLYPGDLLVLHSDGVVEAGTRNRHAFGLDRLQACVEANREHPLDAICTQVLGQATDHARGEQHDDMMVVLIRRTLPAVQSVAG